ncbi:MAG: DUF3106 domain-containing protein [Acidobacteriaceae bacterium]|nr:DUF3106 domain-containing protein [Acidobacteriaceae bacterium]
MIKFWPIRHAFVSLATLACAFSGLTQVWAQQASSGHHLPNAQFSANPNPVIPNGPGAPAAPGTPLKGAHLNQWMEQHSDMTAAQRRSELQREPGFRELPAATQQRILDRLAQLETMTPEQRKRTLEHTEQMERLNPQQRAQVRSAMLLLSGLPPEQRKTVMHAFRELRVMQVTDRRQALSNGRFNYLNQQQRVTLDQLMLVEPMLPLR